MSFGLKRKAEVVKSSLLGTCNKKPKGKLQFWYVLELDSHRGAGASVAASAARHEMSELRSWF